MPNEPICPPTGSFWAALSASLSFLLLVMIPLYYKHSVLFCSKESSRDLRSGGSLWRSELASLSLFLSFFITWNLLIVAAVFDSSHIFTTIMFLFVGLITVSVLTLLFLSDLWKLERTFRGTIYKLKQHQRRLLEFFFAGFVISFGIWFVLLLTMVILEQRNPHQYKKREPLRGAVIASISVAVLSFTLARLGITQQFESRLTALVVENEKSRVIRDHRRRKQRLEDRTPDGRTAGDIRPSSKIPSLASVPDHCPSADIGCDLNVIEIGSPSTSEFGAGAESGEEGGRRKEEAPPPTSPTSSEVGKINRMSLDVMMMSRPKSKVMHSATESITISGILSMDKLRQQTISVFDTDQQRFLRVVAKQSVLSSLVSVSVVLGCIAMALIRDPRQCFNPSTLCSVLLIDIAACLMSLRVYFEAHEHHEEYEQCCWRFDRCMVKCAVLFVQQQVDELTQGAENNSPHSPKISDEF